jgi:hypothetical protein
MFRSFSTAKPRLRIFFRHAFKGGQPRDFIGAKVTGICVTSLQFSVSFPGNLELAVGLSKQDYAGPEAMVLQVGDSDFFVWQ